MLGYIHMDVKHVMVILNRISKVIRHCVLSIKIRLVEGQSLVHACLGVPCEHFTERFRHECHQCVPTQFCKIFDII